MDATAWFIVSISGYSIAGVFFVLAIILYFKLKIPAVIGDLSGRTATKQIQEIRKRNAATGYKIFKPDVFNLERGKLTEPVKESGIINRNEAVGQNVSENSHLTFTNGHIADTIRLTEETELLIENGTGNLTKNQSGFADETTVLKLEESPVYQEPSHKKTAEFKIIKDIKVIHTKERV